MSEYHPNVLLSILALAILSFLLVDARIDGNLVGLCIVGISGLGGFEIYRQQKKVEKMAKKPVEN